MPDLVADYSQLIKRVDRLVADVESAEELADTILALAEKIASSLVEELGITGGRIYRRVGDMFRLIGFFGDAKRVDDPPGVPASYQPVAVCVDEGVVLMDRDDPSLDRTLEAALGVERFAALSLGEGRFMLSFDIASHLDRDDVLFTLGIVRHGINQRVREEQVEDVYRQARQIQASILPRRMPRFGNFDIGGRSFSLERVGGDFYDFIPLSDKILGLTVADVSGHGLPAALQVRDIYMGLRMGLGREYKIVRTIERLNRIIHQSTMTSRFVSLFYGELELNGNLLYVNAGHPPPFHLSASGEATLLDVGGVVLGPLPDASYERGFARVRPGDMVVLYTDGIVETYCGDATSGQQYGLERLIEAARGLRGRPAQEIVEGLFADLQDFCPFGAPGDDRTLVVLTLGE